jgi:hypothetical protein
MALFSYILSLLFFPFSSLLFHTLYPLPRPEFTASKHRKIDSRNILFTGLSSSIFSPELSLFRLP